MTLSKALVKSIMMTSVVVHFSIAAETYVINLSSCVLQDLFFRKPCCWGDRILFDSRCCMMELTRICFSSLQGMLVREMGL